MPRDNRARRIKRFAMYLEQAIHDERHIRTEDARVVHFWDADSLFFTAFGFRVVRARDLMTNTTLAQALLSAGLLGPVSMVSHHRVELFSQLDRRIRDVEERSASDLGDLDAFLDSYPEEAAAWEAAVPTFRTAVKADDLQATRAALRCLQTMKRGTFVLFEATTGSLASRIRRIVADQSIVDFNAVDLPRTKQVLGDPRFSMFLEGVMRYRNDRQTANAAADAAALTTIAILNDRANSASQPVYPRFFTSTTSLRQLYASEPWVRQELRYNIRSDRRRQGTVWRDPYYYVLRAMFPSVNSATVFPTTVLVPDRPTFDELAGLSGELIRAVQAGDDQVEEMADSYLLSDGKPLWDVIEDLEDSGRAAAWLRLRHEDYAERWTDGVRAIRALSTSELTREAINGVLADTTMHMRNEVLDAACHTSLLKAYSAITSEVQGLAESDLLRQIDQLAGLRWGVSSDRLAEFLDIGTNGPNAARSLKIARVKWLLQSPKRMECALLCLLAVDDYTSVRRLVDMVPAKNLSPVLSAMSLAAKVRERRLFPTAELEQLMEQCVTTFESLTESKQTEYCVAFGYVGFHIWRRSSFASDVDSPHDDAGWAGWSHDVVWNRLRDVKADLFKFALNHVVYVQSVANLARPDAYTSATRLKDLAEASGLYRLADTVGHRMTLVARRDELWTENRSAWLLKHIGDLREASNWLKAAQAGAFSDREVDQHVEFLEATIRDAQFG